MTISTLPARSLSTQLNPPTGLFWHEPTGRWRSKIGVHTAKSGKDASSLNRGLVSGAALPSSLRQELASRGVEVLQCYATAELGIIAYESALREGMIVNEDLLLEIVRPGTGDPLPAA